MVEVKNNEVGGDDGGRNSRGRDEDGSSGIRWRRLVEVAWRRWRWSRQR
jgi:hypothetical protein